MPRRAARTDRNHGEIREAFRKLGCSWLDLSAVGRGCPDALVGFAGLVRLVEIKDGSKPPSRRALRPLQRVFMDDWTGGVSLVESIEDAACVASLLRYWHARLTA